MTPHIELVRRLSVLVGAVRAGAPLPADVAGITEAVEHAAAAVPAPPWPDGLVGRSCALAPAAWHGNGLAACCTLYRAENSVGAALRARLVYHARQLAHILDPADARLRPSVSIVIPVFNRARMVRQAIDSCLAQTAPVEIVVVDDGSTDCLTQILAPVVDRIVLLRQENRGVSLARRAGIEAAGGDFIHFLDSDDLLLPACIAHKLSAFAAVPDAGLCYGGVINYDPQVIRRELIAYEHPDGGPLCATGDLMAAVARSMPFLPSTVMMPRWLLLETAAFHEGLRRGEDIRLWFSLGLRGTRAIGLAEELTLRRNDARSLGRVPRETTCSHEIAVLMNLCDLPGAPHAWHLAWQYLNVVRASGIWGQINAGQAPALSGWRTATVRTFRALGEEPQPDGLSVLPLLVLLLAGLRALDDELGIGDEPAFAFHRDLQAGLHHAARRAPPIGDGDVAAWLVAGRRAGFDSAAAARLLELSVDWEAAGCAHLLPTLRMLLALASPDFDPAAYHPPRLQAVLSRRVRGRAPSARPGPAGRLADIVPPGLIRLLPGGQEKIRTNAVRHVDRLLALASWPSLCAFRRQSRTWRQLEQACDPSARLHLDALRRALPDGGPPPVDWRAVAAKVRLCARALARSLGSSDRAHRPSVSLVVAATCGDAGLAATVESCLGQRHDRVDILVVGAGLDALPPDLAARVRTIPMVRPGAAAARNVGMAHSAADFVMFADPGTTLAPDCVAAHLAAFDAAPGAELSIAWPPEGRWPPDHDDIGSARSNVMNVIGSSGLERDAGGKPVPAFPAPGSDLMTLLAAGGSPGAGQWLAPRWLMLETGPVDRWLISHELERYAFRLALRQPVLARVDYPHACAGPQAQPADCTGRTVVGLLALADLLATPGLWRHCCAMAATLRWPQSPPDRWSRVAILLELVEERLGNAIRDLAARGPCGGPSPQIAIALTLAGLDHGDIGSARSNVINVSDSNNLERDAGGKPVPAFPGGPAGGEGWLRQALLQAAVSAAGITGADLRHVASLGIPVAAAGRLRCLAAGSQRLPPQLAGAVAMMLQALEGEGVPADQEASAPRAR